MSLEDLLKELDKTKSKEQDLKEDALRDKHAAEIRSKEEEIFSLKEEIDTLRCWLDHSALPAANPISKRKDSMGLIKMNFGKDKPAPDFWAPGEKALLDSIQPDQEPEPAQIPQQEPAQEALPSQEVPLEERLPLFSPEEPIIREIPEAPEPTRDEEPPEIEEPFLDNDAGKPSIPDAIRAPKPDLPMPQMPELGHSAKKIIVPSEKSSAPHPPLKLKKTRKPSPRKISSALGGKIKRKPALKKKPAIRK